MKIKQENLFGTSDNLGTSAGWNRFLEEQTHRQRLLEMGRRLHEALVDRQRKRYQLRRRRLPRSDE